MTRATPPTGPDDIGPDPWLREALRHAPDAEVAVPAAVREAILRQARSAAHEQVRRALPAPQGGVWRRWVGGWLRPTRLGYSGAFVVLLVAGIWGLEGLDEQAREPLKPSSPEAVMAEATPAIAASAPTPAAPATSGTSATSATLKPATDAPTPIVAAAPAKTEPPAPLAPSRVQPPAAARAAIEPATKAARDSANSDAPAEPGLSKQMATPSAPPPPAPATASPAPATAAAETAGPAVVPKGRPPGSGTALLSAQQDRAGGITPDPLASLLQRATDDASLRWSVGSREGSVGTAQRAWLDALRTATAGRWTRASAAPAAPVVQLSSPAGPLASLGVDGKAGTLWVAIGDDIYRAPLSEDMLSRFEEARSGW